ncbi:alpha/beta hydrolase fold domain-containing protein [Promicromonospora kroppenstedtii]|uniref:Alpha/beta hydrolase fold domain-containing protein n=1 Tax=Promicromonospora kroppenstedtii TaxID=440482 RepID=A0ABW7XNK1_9MICO
MSEHVLEPAAQAFADATAKPPLLYELGVEGARKLLDDVQAAPVDKPDVDEKWIIVPADVGDVRVRIVKPLGTNRAYTQDSQSSQSSQHSQPGRHSATSRPDLLPDLLPTGSPTGSPAGSPAGSPTGSPTEPPNESPDGSQPLLPTILYVHGGGWILGNAGTHDRLVRELAVGVGVAVVFVEYTRSPEAQYPVAIEQAYATARWITREGAAEGLDASRLAVVGDSVGGNMTAALAILAKQRGDVTFVHQSLYYPVTDAGQDTGSYREFADGPHLTAKAMAWFWDAYLPDLERRGEITASPLRATAEDLAGLPEAFLVVDENDVLRDEGEAYARHLIAAGVPTTTVRYNGTIHDFLMLNPLRGTAATTAALEQAVHVLRKALTSGTTKTSKPSNTHSPAAPSKGEQS